MAKKSKKPQMKIKPVRAWAGVSDGRLHGWGPTAGNYYEIYRTKAQARAAYELYVPVLITPLKTVARH